MHLSFVRPRLLAFAALAAALAAAIASTPLLAQRRETGAFVVRLGNDTIALEQYTRVGNRIEGDLLSRVPATRLFHWVITVSKAGLPQKVEYFPRNSDGTTNPRGAQSITLTFAPDSITRETQWVDSVQVRRIANDGTVLPAFGTALAAYELGTRWMRLAKRDSAGIRFMGVNAAQLPNPLALRMWRDSARFDFFGNPMMFRVDRAGRIATSLHSVKLTGGAGGAVEHHLVLAVVIQIYQVRLPPWRAARGFLPALLAFHPPDSGAPRTWM